MWEFPEFLIHPYLWYVHVLFNVLFEQDDAQDAQWFSIHNLPKLAFDHKTILQDTFLRFAKDLDQGEKCCFEIDDTCVVSSSVLLLKRVEWIT